MPRLVKVNEATAAKRSVVFHIVDATDGLTPETGEAGGQPQVSINLTAFTDTGIGTLSHLGNGRYYATLTTGSVSTADTWIESRYKSTTTAESIGDAVFVVNYDPADFGGYVADATWDEAQSGHTSAGTFGKYVDAQVSTLTAPSAASVADAVLDELVTGHTTTDSVGYMLDVAISTRAAASTALSSATWTAQKAGYLDAAVSSASAPTAAAVADAVWDEAASGHSTADTFGAFVFRVLGLSNENTVIATATYDGDGRPLTGTKRIYNSAANANANDGATGLVAAYSFTATYNSDGYPVTYTEVKA